MANLKTLLHLCVESKDSLRSNKKYYGEYYVNIPNTLRLACNNIEMLFTDTAIYSDPFRLTFNPIIANAQIVNYGNPIINDTLNWVKVSGIFKAKGGEQYLTVGNFRPDSQTISKVILPSSPYYGKTSYYIDDVSVIPLDSMCIKADAGRDTTIKTGDSAFIGSYTNGIDSVLWLQNGTIKKDSTRPGFWVKPSSNTFYVLHQVVNGCFSSDTVYINVVLPLRFISYTLRQAQGDNGVLPPSTLGEGLGVRSLWTTANEINVSHYNITKSIDGRNFKTIGKVKANNKSSNEYSFTDKQAFDGLNYYRIVGIDNDGKLNYSAVKTLTINHSSLNVTVFPNPAKDVVTISGVGIKEVNIINSLGQVVIHQTINNNTYKCNIQLLPKGLYLLNIITTKNYVYNEKLIIQ